MRPLVNILVRAGYVVLSAVAFLVSLLLGPSDRASEVIWETKRDLMRR